MKSVKCAFLSLTILAVSSISFAAQGRQEIVLDSPAGTILAHPAVAELVAKASKMRASLFIDRIVIGDQSDNKSPICIELKWSGGDVIGTFGAIHADIAVNSLGGRGGVSYKIINANLKLSESNNPGMAACE